MKALSKINQKIQDLAKKIDQIENYDLTQDFETRDGMIVGCIKVHSYIDAYDVDRIAGDLLKDYPDGPERDILMDEILEEFHEDRLWNIVNHCNEWTVTWFKEELEERCHINDLQKRAFAYKAWRDREDLSKEEHRYHFYYKHYLSEFKRFAKRKKNTYKDFVKYLRKTNPYDYREAERLDQFKAEVWQFGRSGGWLSVCSKDELNPGWSSIFDDYAERLVGIQDNDEFNEVLEHNFDVKGHQEKQEFIKDMQYHIEEFEKKKAAIQYYVDQFENAAKDMREVYLNELHYEISRFIEEFEDMQDGTLEPNVEILPNCTHIRTTLGVTIPMDEFILAYKLLNRKIRGLAPGSYEMLDLEVKGYNLEWLQVKENDVLVKAGCHRFSWNQVTEALKTNQLI